MKTIDQLLSFLDSQDVRLWSEGDRLRYQAPKGTLTPAIIEQLKAHKTEILQMLPKTHTKSNFSWERIRPIPRQGELPLSFAQQRLWFIDQLEGKSATYNMPVVAHLIGTLHITALEQSLREILRRHEALRTRFPMMNGSPVQVIAPDLTITMPIIDLQYLPKDQQNIKLQHLAQQEAQQPFDLANGPLLRTTLLKLGEKSHVLMLVMHHIVSDGWSLGVLIHELSALYEASAEMVASPLPELPIQYADFAHWEQQWLQGEGMKKTLSYWKHQLANLPTLKLPTDHPRPSVQTFRGAKQNLQLPQDLSGEIKALSRRAGTTLFMTLMAAFKTLLHCYTEQDDIVIGTDVANRNRIETEGLIGFFVNQLVLRTDLSGNPTFQELLGRVRQVTLAAYDHQDMPFDQLVAAINPERNLSSTPLFQSKFVFQNAPMPSIKLKDLTLNMIELDDDTAKFDLLLSLWETEQELKGNLEYSTDLFNISTINQMLRDYETILRKVVVQPEITLQALREILTVARKQEQFIKNQELEEVTIQKLKKIRKNSI